MAFKSFFKAGSVALFTALLGKSSWNITPNCPSTAA